MADKHPNQTEDVRTRIADLIYRHKTEREISAELGIALGVVSKHVQALKAEWRARRERMLEEHFDEQLARLEMAESGIWDKVLEGYAPAVERWLGIMDMRNKLLGLYAPTKSEVDVGETLARLMGQITLESPDPPKQALPAPQINVIEGESRDI